MFCRADNLSLLAHYALVFILKTIVVAVEKELSIFMGNKIIYSNSVRGVLVAAISSDPAIKDHIRQRYKMLQIIYPSKNQVKILLIAQILPLACTN